MKKKTKGILITTIILIFALGAGAILGAVTWIIQDTPDISDYKGSSEATLIYSQDGELLTKLYKENRVYVPLERIPEDLKNAIIAIEDTNFYVHHGIDFWGIARAMVTNIRQGRLAQGASTITQQLARNAFLTLRKTFYRKIQEAYLAVQFERLYTKSEILEMYLNEIFLGHSAYGVQTAAQQYFGKSVWELDLAESALIAGLPQSPNNYSPLNDPERAIRRRNVVLDRMAQLDYISEEEAENAKNAELNLNDGKELDGQHAHYFILYVRDQLLKEFGASMVYNGGLKVHTTIDIGMQKTAEDRVNAKLENGYLPSYRKEGTDKLQPQLALVSLDVNSGAIRAMVGGRGNDQFNRSYQAVRQPGSAFKPFVYAAGIAEHNLTTGTIINDLPMLASKSGKDNLNIWPRNYGDHYRGLITLNTALTHSVNIAAVKTIQDIGVKNTIDFTEKLGISTFTQNDGLDDHYSLALGGLNRGVTPLEMAAAYSVFANKGVYTEPYAIEEVYDKNDKLIYQAQPKKRIVMSETDSYLITSMLQSVVNNGTGRRAQMDRDVAGKTGTTNDYTDAWFVGYTPQIATSVWIGEDTRNSMEYNNSSTVSSGHAAQIWGEYMREIVKDMPVLDFHMPENIVEAPVEPYTGLKPNEYSPRIEVLPFKEGTEPEKTESLHGPVETLKIDRETGLIATDNCPENQVEERHYLQSSGIRIGPAEKSFREVNSNKNQQDLVRGRYSIDVGEPVQQIDHEYGIPKVNRNGEPRYETRPNRSCDVHQGNSSDDSSDSILGNIFDIFGN
jgi:penicillin-binding protein 1A